MNYHLGAVLVRGGKIISTGHNHCRTHYDGLDLSKHGHRKPVSMHAEMHAIYNLTGMSPSFKQQVQPQLKACPLQRERHGCEMHRLLSGHVIVTDISYSEEGEVIVKGSVT